MQTNAGSTGGIALFHDGAGNGQNNPAKGGVNGYSARKVHSNPTSGKEGPGGNGGKRGGVKRGSQPLSS